LIYAISLPSATAEQATFIDVAAEVQPKMVKIFGAGGAALLEGHQSGFLVSDQGHILTAWSYVLDEDTVTVVLADGQRVDARLVAADPRTEVALLKCEYDTADLPYFNLRDAVTLAPGERILAFTNIFRIATGDEPVSVQHGLVAGIAPLVARSGAAPVRFRGDVYFVDAVTSNPGAAGGALTDRRGRLAAIIGKERRGVTSNLWLNYAIPVAEFAESVDAMLDGRFAAPDAGDDGPAPENSATVSALGIVLVPDVVTKTPAFVDAVRPDSPAAKAGIRPDDLIVFVESRLIQSCRDLHKAVARHEHDDPIRIAIIRDDELIERTLEPPEVER
jgi:serine protease Do